MGNSALLLLALASHLPPAFAGKPGTDWEKERHSGIALCKPTPLGHCSLGWEHFWNMSKPFPENWYSRTWVYDNTCIDLLGEGGSLATGQDWMAAYDIHCKYLVEPVKITGEYEILGTKQGYERTGEGPLGDVWFFPYFTFRGLKFGGATGCKCGHTGIDEGAAQACYCTFPCVAGVA